jgi:hypothetical protein
MTRQQAVDTALASVRLEGLDPTSIEPLADAWVRGDISVDELVQLAQRVAAGEDAHSLLPIPQT